MGCDIHMYVEYRTPRKVGQEKQPNWWPHGGHINPGRDYNLFSFIAGQRGNGLPLTAVKGLPDDISYKTKEDAFLYITDNVNEDSDEPRCTLERAESYAKHGSKIIYADVDGKQVPRWVEHPDWHSHTWLTADELELAITATIAMDRMVDAGYHALVATLRAFEKQGYEARVVVWFDN